MSYLKTFRKRTTVTGIDGKEKMLNGARNRFEEHLRISPSSHTVYYSKTTDTFVDYKHKLECIIIDVNDNDSKTFDEKKILVRHDQEFQTGYYVKWNDRDWLVIGEDIKGYSAHKKYIMKRCNSSINHRVGKSVRRIPIVVSNLTLYSDGLANLKYNEFGDAKRNILVGRNITTNTLEEGVRVLLNKTAIFRLTHTDDFTYDNILNFIAVQEQIQIKDDVEKNIAYNEHLSLIEDDSQELEKPNINDGFTYSPIEIKGADHIYLGATSKYTVENNQ